jgi:hypothetical protein
MSIRSNASTVVMIVSSTLYIANVVKGYCTKKFSKNFQELHWRIGVQGNNGVHAITQTSTQRTDRPVQHVCMSCLRAVEIGYTRDQ